MVWRRFDKRELTKLKQLRRSGYSIRRIAEKLGRNESSIGQKVRELGLERGFDDAAFDRAEGLVGK